MNRTLSIMTARKKFNSLPETLVRDGEIDVIKITRRGKPVLAVLPWELYEAIAETLEIMADKVTMEQLRQSIREMDEDATVSWKNARQELTR